MTALDEVAGNLVESEPGLWVSRTTHDVSYPESGHSTTFEVEDTSFWFQHRNRVIGDLVERYASGRSFFDIGGGNGPVSAALHDRGFDTVLVEPGSTGVSNARQRGLPTVVNATLEDAGFRSGSIEALGAFDVVEHIDDDREFLVSVGELLEPGGFIFLTVPAFTWLWSEADDQAGHYRRYRRPELQDLLVQTGFRPVEVSYFFMPLPPLVFVGRSLPHRLRRRKAEAVATARDHSAGGGATRKVIDRLLAWEARHLGRGTSLPFGTSLVAVAQKPDAPRST